MATTKGVEMMKFALLLGAILGFLGVALGAFGAHALKDKFVEPSAGDLHQGGVDVLNLSQTLSQLNESLQIQGARFEEIATTTKMQAASASEIIHEKQKHTNA